MDEWSPWIGLMKRRKVNEGSFSFQSINEEKGGREVNEYKRTLPLPNHFLSKTPKFSSSKPKSLRNGL